MVIGTSIARDCTRAQEVASLRPADGQDDRLTCVGAARWVNMPIPSMDQDEPAFAGEAAANLQDDLRQQISSVLLERVDLVTADTVAIFPYSGTESLDADYCARLGRLLVQSCSPSRFATDDSTRAAGSWPTSIG